MMSYVSTRCSPASSMAAANRNDPCIRMAVRWRMMIIGMGMSDMNILNIHDLPDDLYKRLLQLAHARNRSLSALVVDMLFRAVDNEERRNVQANQFKVDVSKRPQTHRQLLICYVKIVVDRLLCPDLSDLFIHR
jgi:plasmid stability protein